MTWIAAGSAGVAALGGMFGSKKQSKLQKQALAMQREAANAKLGYSMGGITADNEGINLGQWGGLQDMFREGAGDAMGSMVSGVPDDVMNAFGAMQPFMNRGRFRPEQMEQMFSGAGGLADELSRGTDDIYNSTLGRLRQEAAPEEERMSQAHNQRLFSMGQLGTTGGAMQTEAFAKGLGQADIGRQLAAGGEARAASQDVMGRFSKLFGGGMEMADLDEQREGNQYDRTWQRFQDTVGMQELPSRINSSRMNVVNSMMQGAQGINDMGMSVFDMGNNLLTGKRAALLGQANGAMNVSRSASPMADMFANLGAGAMGSGGLADMFKRFQARNAGPGQDPNMRYAMTGQ
jgi:hypothetical protein